MTHTGYSLYSLQLQFFIDHLSSLGTEVIFCRKLIEYEWITEKFEKSGYIGIPRVPPFRTQKKDIVPNELRPFLPRTKIDNFAIGQNYLKKQLPPNTN